MKEFRFAIMGAAHIAVKFCDAVSLVENCRVAAVASKSMERAEKFAENNNIPKAYDDYETMLREEKPDCVYIAVTQNDHYRLAMLCIAHHTPVLCEKAMFMNSRDAKMCFEAAKKQGVFVMEAMWSIFQPALIQAKRLLENGAIGELTAVDTAIGFAAPREGENRYFTPALGGGAAYDITVYGYEITRWMVRREVKDLHVVAARGESGVDVTEVLLLKLDGNIPATIRTTFMTGVEDRMEIWGTEGKIVIPHPHWPNGFTLYKNGTETEHYTDEVTKNGFVYEVEECIRCIRNGMLQSSIVTQDATVECAAVFDRIQAAIKE